MSNEILAQLVPILSSVVLAVLGYLGTKLVAFINAKTHNEFLRSALVRLEDAVFTAVRNVQAVYVDAIKAAKDPSSPGGTSLTDEEAKAAKQKALDAIKSYLGAQGLALITQVLGLSGSALDDFLLAKIEAQVSNDRAVEQARVDAEPVGP